MAKPAAVVMVPVWEWQDDGTAWTPFHHADSGTIEKAYQKVGTSRPYETKDLSWNRGFGTLYRYDFSLMKQVNTESKRVRMLRRTEAPGCPKGHAMAKAEPGPGAQCSACGRGRGGSPEWHYCSRCRCWRCAGCSGQEATLRELSTAAEWIEVFRLLSREQVQALRHDTACSAMLKRDDLEVVWRSWSDVGRTFGEDTGQNTTTVSFFAVAPGSRGDQSQFVPFPAVRAPNYLDPVDVLPCADALRFTARTLKGSVQSVTLKEFLARIGEFIAGISPSQRWDDPIDDTPMQQSTQFSVIPVPSGKTNVGVAAVGAQAANLHVVVGPGGEVGWAPEKPGVQRIFFRSGDGGRELRAISLVPEKRKEVTQAFFKVEVRDETVEEERKRYEKTENRLLHLQIAMDGVKAAKQPDGQPARLSNCPMGHGLAQFEVPRRKRFRCDQCDCRMGPGSTAHGCRQCDFDLCPKCWSIGEGPRSSAPKHGHEVHDGHAPVAAAHAGVAPPHPVGACAGGAQPKKYGSGRGGPPLPPVRAGAYSSRMRPQGAAPPLPQPAGRAQPAPTSAAPWHKPEPTWGPSMGPSAGLHAAAACQPPARRAPALRHGNLAKLEGGAQMPALLSPETPKAAPRTPTPPAAPQSPQRASWVKTPTATTRAHQWPDLCMDEAVAVSDNESGHVATPPGRPYDRPCDQKVPHDGPCDLDDEDEEFEMEAALEEPEEDWPEECYDTGHEAEKEDESEEQEGEEEEGDSREGDDADAAPDGVPAAESGHSDGYEEQGAARREEGEPPESGHPRGDCKKKQGKVVAAGLQLAQVSEGEMVAAAELEDKVPPGATRRAGVAVRATWLHYGVAADGKVDAERVRRFAKQIAFRRRELGLPHGSLVSGIGSWGGPENCPIKLFGFRLTDANENPRCQLPEIRGVLEQPLPKTLPEACRPAEKAVSGIAAAAKQASVAAQALHKMSKGKVGSPEHIAAMYLYTMEHQFYRSLNAAMRDKDRSQAVPYFLYLRLLFDALAQVEAKLGGSKPSRLYRGVNLDLSGDHPVGQEVYWWGASSCTTEKSVALGFLGCSGKRTLFHVTPLSAVPIRDFSAFRGEEEWLLRPGTRLRVDKVQTQKGGLTEVHLTELPPPRGIE